MSSRLHRLAGFAVAASLIGVACGGSADETDSAATETTTTVPSPADTTATVPPSADTAAPDTAAPVDGVPEILAFSSPLVGGGELDSATLAERPTAYWFWAPT